MQKIKEFLSENWNMEDPLVKKGIELMIYGGLCLVLCLGIFAASVFDDGIFLQKLSSMVFVLSMVLLALSGRYFFYVKTRRYEIISGTVLGVQVRQGLPSRNQDCLIQLLGDDGKRYQYHARYRQALHKKEVHLIVYAAKVNGHLIRDGYILLDSILLQKQEDIQNYDHERSEEAR